MNGDTAVTERTRKQEKKLTATFVLKRKTIVFLTYFLIVVIGV